MRKKRRRRVGCREVDKGQVREDGTLIQWEWREEDEF